jgi:hypothetical protein
MTSKTFIELLQLLALEHTLLGNNNPSSRCFEYGSAKHLANLQGGGMDGEYFVFSSWVQVGYNSKAPKTIQHSSTLFVLGYAGDDEYEKQLTIMEATESIALDFIDRLRADSVVSKWSLDDITFTLEPIENMGSNNHHGFMLELSITSPSTHCISSDKWSGVYPK